MNLSHKDPGMVTTSPPDVFADVLFVCFLFLLLLYLFIYYYLVLFVSIFTFANIQKL